MRHPTLQHPRTRWPAWLAVVALLALQWLALGHAISHGQARAEPTATASADPWGHDAGDAFCQALDHFCHSDALTTSAAPLTLAAAPLPPALSLPSGITPASRWAAPARGPPQRG